MIRTKITLNNGQIIEVESDSAHEILGIMNAFSSPSLPQLEHERKVVVVVKSPKVKKSPKSSKVSKKGNAKNTTYSYIYESSKNFDQGNTFRHKATPWNRDEILLIAKKIVEKKGVHGSVLGIVHDLQSTVGKKYSNKTIYQTTSMIKRHLSGKKKISGLRKDIIKMLSEGGYPRGSLSDTAVAPKPSKPSVREWLFNSDVTTPSLSTDEA